MPDVVAAIASQLTPVLGVLVVIIALVVAHELGHFIAAKLSGMRVEEFAVGFGPRKLTVFQKSGTEYNLRPIPAGGFVRIAGMEPGEDSPPDGFNAQPVWKRIAVVFAGPLASFVFAYVIFCSLGMTAGLPMGDPEPVVANVVAGKPAARIGLKPGDRILEVEGKKVATGPELRKSIEKRPGQDTRFLVKRGNRTLTVSGKPEAVAEPSGTKGGATQMVGKLGIEMAAKRVRVGFIESIEKGTMISYNMLRELIKVIFSKRLAQEAGGPITIINVTHQAAQTGVGSLAIWTAALSLNFAVLNLLPIPILDGGLLLLLGIEAVRRRRLSARAYQAAMTVGLALLAVIIVLVVAKDISRLFS